MTQRPAGILPPATPTTPEAALALVTALPDPTALIDRDGTVRAANLGFALLLGHPTPERLVGSALAAVLDDPDTAAELLRHRRQGRERRATLPAGGRASDGVRVLLRPLPSLDGWGVVTLTDPAPVRALEDEVEQLRTALRGLELRSRVGTWTYDLATGRLSWSSWLEELAPQDAANGGIDALLAMLHPDDHGRVRDAMHALIARGVPYAITYRLQVAGQVRWVHDSAEVERDVTGAAIRVVGTVHDVTELHHQREVRAEVELTSRTALDTVPTLVAVLDDRGAVRSTNQAWDVMVAAEPDRFVLAGGLPGLQALLDREDQPRLRTLADALSAMVDTGDGELTLDLPLGDDPGRRWYELRARPLPTRTGGVVITLTEITARKQTEQRLAHRATTDDLTGLARRERLLAATRAALEASVEHRGEVGLIILDIDGFRFVNRSWGHTVGDQLLVHVARRLRATAPPAATLARLGGDGFVVLIPCIDDPDQLEQLAEQLLTTVHTDRDDAPAVTARVGLTSGRAPTPAAQLLLEADLAVRSAKHDEHTRLAWHTPQLTQRHERRVRLERDLHAALQTGDGLHLRFQPQFQVRDGSIVGFEALLRWNHPELGPVPPDEAVRIAEQSQQIRALGRWVLDRTCEHVAGWLRDDVLAPGVRVSVNVSPRELDAAGYDDALAATLAAHGVPAERLTLELTESALLHDLDVATEVLERCRALGVHLSLDDFGTGHAALDLITALPLDELKIDRSFVAHVVDEPRARTIAATILTLAEQLGLHAVAEGIETEEQRAWLAERACTRGQGYLVAPPLAADDVRSWLSSRSAPVRSSA